MVVYRITIEKYKARVLSGVGAEKVGGRWNAVGTRAVYCSENVSLALLEYYVHSDDISTLPKNIVVAKIQFRDDFIIEELKELPHSWKDHPYTSETTRIFTEFAKNYNNFALKVPSTIVGIEYNVILNPLYKEFGKVAVLDYFELPIDLRLKKKMR